MTMRATLPILMFAVMTWSAASAADFGTTKVSRHHWCPHHTEASYLPGLIGTDKLRAEVEWRYSDAIDTFHASHATTTPRFIWANQAKVACAKAIGYLDYPLRRTPTVEILQKCECFHDRMAAYSRR